MKPTIARGPLAGRSLERILRKASAPRGLLACATMCALCALQGCSTPAPVELNENRIPYPLPDCKSPTQTQCSVAFFSDPRLISKRIPEGFPRRSLELWDAGVRTSECAIADTSCLQRLETLSSYFNPDGPPAGKIGVALEGGGNKSGPFTLGVLAGIEQQGYWDRIGAIASVSGGSYAASFYFNRIFDLYTSDRHPTPRRISDERANWFRSCIPDYFSSDNKQYFSAIDAKTLPSCGEMSNPGGVFNPQYRYQEQVWMHHDLLLLDNHTNTRTRDSSQFRQIANLGELILATAATVPFQFVARTIFRWPVNSAPSKLAYALGLERQYGYSPDAWAAAVNREEPIWRQTIDRRRDRTLNAYADTVGDRAPLWVIVTTAPGYIDGWAWAKPAPRDPARQQFEITPTGFGSGIYGYARAQPDAPYDFSGPNPKGLPILDAVVASAAFFDDNETQISKEPLRLFAGAFQQFANVDWFSEIRNFNKDDESRTRARALTWPFYLHRTEEESKTPYIHLQDGGNAENAGIFPLLRRGYRTIIYAHGTTDVDAEFAAICHLKNQLEFDGNYYVVSRDLERIVGALPISDDDRAEMLASRGAGGHFLNYLDQLCTQQIDGSDLAAFDGNDRRDPAERVRAVAKVFCGRLGQYDDIDEVGYPRRAQPDTGYKPCAEYAQRFRWYGADSAGCPTCVGPGFPLTFPIRRSLFFQSSVAPLRFHVCRGDALRLAHPTRRQGGKSNVAKPLSTIIAVVPAVDWHDVNTQVQPRSPPLAPSPGTAPWNSFCAKPVDDRKAWRIDHCEGPDGTVLSANATSAKVTAQDLMLSCTALAHVLEDPCTTINKADVDFQHPIFPQNDLIGETLHTTYPAYAAYFDLGREQVKRALNRAQFPAMPGDDDESACAIPETPPTAL